MRQIIPHDITRTSLTALLAQGVDQEVANYLWHSKVLWLTCMHPDDFPKVCVCDVTTAVCV